jgi:hypothetical protein
MPILTVHGATVYIKDVAQVRDGYTLQNQHRARQRPPLGIAEGFFSVPAAKDLGYAQELRLPDCWRSMSASIASQPAARVSRNLGAEPCLRLLAPAKCIRIRFTTTWNGAIPSLTPRWCRSYTFTKRGGDVARANGADRTLLKEVNETPVGFRWKYKLEALSLVW